ncbi:MAG: glycosyltransferase family 4 protein [Bacteroidota bacterium]
MRILVHDFAGHPFQVQLSRTLARRGHTVLHAYCASLSSTPQAMEAQADDPETFEIRALALDKPINKQAFVTRWRQERAYGHLAAAALRDFQPDVVLSANTPLDAQRTLLDASRAAGARFVYWVQDLIGWAAERLLREKVPLVGGAVGSHYARMERALLAESDALVLVSEDFYDAVPEIRRHPSAHVIPIWAPLDAVPVRPRDNAWAEAQGFREGALRFVYAGTLGLKHNPALLLNLAHRIPHEVVVVSQGAGIEWLRERKEIESVKNLRLLPFQPFEDLPDVLGAADVLVAILTPDAGVFSVPSKVLTYLCAGRPLLLAVPSKNQAAQIVTEHEAGLVVGPKNNRGFLNAGAELGPDAARREQMGANARTYAERHFDIEPITDRFEGILVGEAAGR